MLLVFVFLNIRTASENVTLCQKMEAQLPIPAPLQIHHNASEKWETFLLAWENQGVSEKAKKVQVATLLTVIG